MCFIHDYDIMIWGDTMTKHLDFKEGKGRKSLQRMQQFLVLQYLLEHTDENHFVGAQTLVDYLKETCEIHSERRSIFNDIREINIAYIINEHQVTYNEAVEYLEDDPDLATIKYKKKNGYYVARRPLHPSDARLIVECLHTARVVPPLDTQNISEDIGKLLSEHQREEIKHDAFAVARVKTNNKELFYNVDTIHNAMSERIDGKAHVPEKIRFKYLKYTIQNLNEMVERRRGVDYVVSPHAIIINEGNYYLLAIDNKSKKLRTYRIDRMKKLKLTGEPRERTAEINDLKEYLDTYSKRVFSMYGGKRESVRIRFVNSLLDTVVDRFGDYASYFTEDKDHFTVTVSVEISPTFFGWLCGFGNKAKLIAPSQVIEEFTKHIEKMYGLYKPRE